MSQFLNPLPTFNFGTFNFGNRGKTEIIREFIRTLPDPDPESENKSEKE